jgi:ribonuclease HII
MHKGDSEMTFLRSKHVHKFWHLSLAELQTLRHGEDSKGLSKEEKSVLTKLIKEKAEPTKRFISEKTPLQRLAMALNRYKGTMRWFELNTQDFLKDLNANLGEVKDAVVWGTVKAGADHARLALMQVRKASDLYNQVSTLCPEKRKHVKKPS